MKETNTEYLLSDISIHNRSNAYNALMSLKTPRDISELILKKVNDRESVEDNILFHFFDKILNSNNIEASSEVIKGIIHLSLSDSITLQIKSMDLFNDYLQNKKNNRDKKIKCLKHAFDTKPDSIAVKFIKLIGQKKIYELIPNLFKNLECSNDHILIATIRVLTKLKEKRDLKRIWNLISSSRNEEVSTYALKYLFQANDIYYNCKLNSLKLPHNTNIENEFYFQISKSSFILHQKQTLRLINMDLNLNIKISIINGLGEKNDYFSYVLLINLINNNYFSELNTNILKILNQYSQEIILKVYKKYYRKLKNNQKLIFIETLSGFKDNKTKTIAKNIYKKSENALIKSSILTCLLNDDDQVGQRFLLSILQKTTNEDQIWYWPILSQYNTKNPSFFINSSLFDSKSNDEFCLICICKFLIKNHKYISYKNKKVIKLVKAALLINENLSLIALELATNLSYDDFFYEVQQIKLDKNKTLLHIQSDQYFIKLLESSPDILQNFNEISLLISLSNDEYLYNCKKSADLFESLVPYLLEQENANKDLVQYTLDGILDYSFKNNPTKALDLIDQFSHFNIDLNYNKLEIQLLQENILSKINYSPKKLEFLITKLNLSLKSRYIIYQYLRFNFQYNLSSPYLYIEEL